LKLIVISEIFQPVTGHGGIIIDRGKSPEQGLIDVWASNKEKSMKRIFWYMTAVLGISLLLFSFPAGAGAQAGTPKAEPAPIAQKLVREGDLAVKLVAALGLEATNDEVEAENQLAQVGILPRNGWIADYPVTPDIIGELQQKLGEVADAGKLSIDKTEALKRFDGAMAELNLAIKPHTADRNYQPKLEIAETYPDPTVINNYYVTEGPPVVTYYSPPPDYYYLYSWVPYPFWCASIWFPGFFVLNDFHRTIVINQRVVFVSNHFRDVRAHRVFRIDPARRFNGRTFAGIGVVDRRGFISTGVPRSDRTIFNGTRTRSMSPGVRTFVPGRSGSPGGTVIRRSPSSGSMMRSGPSGVSMMRSGSSGGGMMRGGSSGGGEVRRGGGGSGRSHGDR
jgi:hypothetical protein